MPNQPVSRGHTANLGAGVVPGNLSVIGVGTPYTISIGGAAAVAHVAAIGVPNIHAVNGATVTVVNTTPTPPAGPDNLTIGW